MKRKVMNFNAGPGMLPHEVLEKAQAEMLDWHDTGMSIMELGHRGPEFQELAARSESNLRSLMNIPENYSIFFLSGGASAQFAMVPLNLFSKAARADYIDTGIWSKKAIEEAARFGTVNVAAKVEEQNGLLTIPPQEQWTLSSDADYVHYTPNETIDGIEFPFVPDTGEVPLVADMSSMIMSCPIDVTRYGVIYAGAQKNLGQAGVTLVIVRQDLIKEPVFLIPSLYKYALHHEHHSFYNTPPTYAWYITSLMLEWIKDKGGIPYFTRLNQLKAAKLYSIIDSSSGFYSSKVHSACRSRMNVVFNLPSEQLTNQFLQQANESGFMNLRGHRLVGGVRVSLYNAIPEECVDRLAAFMQEFYRKNVT